MRVTVESGPDRGRTVEVGAGRLVIGREAGCGLVLADEKSSRRHAQLELLPDGRVSVRDLGSRNGTWVDGRRLAAPAVLGGSERIQIGDTVLALAGASARPAPVAAPPPTPTRLERILLLRTARRAQRLAAVATAGVVAAAVVVTLLLTGVLGGEARPPTVPEVIERALPSVVQIRRFRTAESENGGSGWVWDAAQGLVITNAHVVNAAPRFAVRLAGEDRERPAEIVGVAPCEDLAVLRVADTAGFETMPLGSQAELRQGDDVVALGYPVSLAAADTLTASKGVVSVVRTQSADLYYTAALPDVIQTDAVINPGNSGGPLVDLDHELVGVNTFRNVEAGIEGQFYAIGVDRVQEIVPGLATGRSLGWTGVGFYQPQTADELTAMQLPAQPGLVIAHVVPGTPAADAGLPVPSLIVAVNGTPLDWTVGSYCKLVGTAQTGDTAVFSIDAPGETAPRDYTIGFR